MQTRDEVEKMFSSIDSFKERAMWQLISELGNLEDKDLFVTSSLLLNNSTIGSKEEALELLRQWGQTKLEFFCSTPSEDIIQKRNILIDAIVRARKNIFSSLLESNS